ncbi:MAG: hypothetical protein RL693_1386 [Verrucomicrobiota bacterium]|jgi:predicted Zn-dependent protease with MMP-like domain
MPHSKLLHQAEAEVQRVLANLPREVRAAAEECLVCYEDIGDEPGLSDDLLGLFEGWSRLDPEPGIPEDMPRIRLFLDNINDYAGGDEREYRREVRITYLHELGHYLGWNEEEVEALGL